MKKLFIAILTVALSQFSWAASTAYTHIQAAVGTTLTATTSRAVAFTTQNITAGNWIAGWIWVNDSGGRITSPSVSDGTNGAYQNSLIPVTSGGSFLVFWFPNAAGGVKPTVTASWTGSKTTSAMVIHEFQGIPNDFVLDTNSSTHKTSGTACQPSGVAAAHNNAFVLGAYWNSGANTLTDPPTANPSSSNNVVQSHGIVSSSIYVDSWQQMGDTATSSNMGYTLSSTTEVGDVFQIIFDKLESPYKGSGQTSSTTSGALVLNTTLTVAGQIAYIVATYISGSGEASPRTITDAVNNYIELSHAFNATNSIGISIWYVIPTNNINAGSVTLDFTGSTTGINVTFTATTMTGLNTLDGSSTASFSTTNTIFAAGSFTPAHSGDLIIYAAGGITGTTTGLTAKSDHGLLATNDVVTTNGVNSVDGCFTQSAAAAFNGDFIFATTRKGIAAAVALAAVASNASNQLMMVGAGR